LQQRARAKDNQTTNNVRTEKEIFVGEIDVGWGDEQSPIELCSTI